MNPWLLEHQSGWFNPRKVLNVEGLSYGEPGREYTHVTIEREEQFNVHVVFVDGEPKEVMERISAALQAQAEYGR